MKIEILSKNLITGHILSSLLFLSSCLINNHVENQGDLRSLFEKQLDVKFKNAISGEDSDSDSDSDPDSWENEPKEKSLPKTKNKRPESLVVKPLSINSEIKFKLSKVFDSKSSDANVDKKRNQDHPVVKPLGNHEAKSKLEDFFKSKLNHKNEPKEKNQVNPILDPLVSAQEPKPKLNNVPQSKANQVNGQMENEDKVSDNTVVEPITSNKSSTSNLGQANDQINNKKELDRNSIVSTSGQIINRNQFKISSAKNHSRIIGLDVMKAQSSFSYKDGNSEKFYKVLHSENKIWEFYASDIQINEKTSTDSALKNKRTMELNKNWLNLMDCKFKPIFTNTDIMSLQESHATFFGPNKTVEGLDLFVKIKKKYLSKRCLLYFKPPSEFKLGSMNQYKVTKLFYSENLSDTYVQLKLKTTTSIIVLYLKSCESQVCL